MNDKYLEVIRSIEFEDKQTSDIERFGINRILTSSGGVEFVKLYTDIPYEAHIHDKSSAIFIFLTGSGDLILDGKSFSFKPGDQFDVPAGVKHGFALKEETIFLSIQSHPIQDRVTGEIDIRYE